MRIDDISLMPGGDLVLRGLDSFKAGKITKESLLISICKTELTRIGVSASGGISLSNDAELYLYDLILAEFPDDAHQVYNSLLAQMVSFIRCADLSH